MNKESKKIIIIYNYNRFPELVRAINLNSEKMFKYCIDCLKEVIKEKKVSDIKTQSIFKEIKEILIEYEKYEWIKFIESSP